MPSARHAALILAAYLSLLSLVDARAEHAAMAAQAPAATRAGAAARHVDRAQLMRELETLASPALEGRQTGTPGGMKARQWIVEQFGAIGLTPAGTTGYLQSFTVTTRNVRALLPGGRPFRADHAAANVIGRLAGRGPGARTIVITAHYDHLGLRDGSLYHGADDNASGVAVLLAAARHFAKAPPRHQMVFAALDAEEIGLRGARALLSSPLLPRGRIALNVNLDMVARNDADEIFAAGTYHSPWQTAILDEVQTRASVRIRFGHDRPPALAGGLEDWTPSSDHGPFHEAGIPFVYFGVEDHADYHKPTDTADRIDPRFFGDAADMIVEAIRTFDVRLE